MLNLIFMVATIVYTHVIFDKTIIVKTSRHNDDDVGTHFMKLLYTYLVLYFYREINVAEIPDSFVTGVIMFYTLWTLS